MDVSGKYAVLRRATGRHPGQAPSTWVVITSDNDWSGPQWVTTVPTRIGLMRWRPKHGYTKVYDRAGAVEAVALFTASDPTQVFAYFPRATLRLQVEPAGDE